MGVICVVGDLSFAAVVEQCFSLGLSSMRKRFSMLLKRLIITIAGNILVFRFVFVVE